MLWSNSFLFKRKWNKDFTVSKKKLWSLFTSSWKWKSRIIFQFSFFTYCGIPNSSSGSLLGPAERKYYSSDHEKLLKFEAEGRELATFLRSLEQFIWTVQWKDSTIFETQYFFNLLLEVCQSEYIRTIIHSTRIIWLGFGN